MVGLWLRRHRRWGFLARMGMQPILPTLRLYRTCVLTCLTFHLNPTERGTSSSAIRFVLVRQQDWGFHSFTCHSWPLLDGLWVETHTGLSENWGPPKFSGLRNVQNKFPSNNVMFFFWKKHEKTVSWLIWSPVSVAIIRFF